MPIKESSVEAKVTPTGVVLRIPRLASEFGPPSGGFESASNAAVNETFRELLWKAEALDALGTGRELEIAGMEIDSLLVSDR